MAASTDQPAVPLRRVILEAWPNLWRPRDVILRKIYMDWARTAGIDPSPAASLDEVRHRYFEQVPGEATPSDYDRDELEPRMLLRARMVAAWMVWWTGCVPLACVLWVFHRRIMLLPGPDLIAASVTVIGSFCAFWGFCILGLLLQALFIRPFMALLNWCMAKH